VKIEIDKSQAPTYWVHLILERARAKPDGYVERRLIGATLAQRYPKYTILDHSERESAAQPERKGDFEFRNIVYHVTGVPNLNIIKKCVANIQAGLHPILLVPKN
jgi:hypothetical protein